MSAKTETTMTQIIICQRHALRTRDFKPPVYPSQLPFTANLKKRAKKQQKTGQCCDNNEKGIPDKPECLSD